MSAQGSRASRRREATTGSGAAAAQRADFVAERAQHREAAQARF